MFNILQHIYIYIFAIQSANVERFYFLKLQNKISAIVLFSNGRFAGI